MTGNNTLTQRGQTLVVFALVLIVIVGCLSLVIDIARLYLLDETLSGKVDAASLAGAQDLPTPATAKNTATTCYGAHVSGGAVTTVSPGTAPCNGINTGNADTSFYSIDGDCVAVTTPYQDTFTIAQGYSPSRVIKVRAYRSQNYMIAGIFGLNSKTVYVTGIAFQKGGTVTAIQTLSSSENEALDIDSGTNVTVTGGVQVNSNKSNALHANGNLTATEAINVVGGVNGGGTLSPTPQTGQPSVADPFVSLPAPAVPGTSYGAVTLSSGTRTIDPGRYTGNINVTGGVLTMNPGIYYMDNKDFKNSGTGIINGTGVIIYLSGTGAEMELKNTVNLSAPTSGTYSGVLVFQDRSSTQDIELKDEALSGTFSGALYAAGGDIEIDLNTPGTIQNTQLVANKIKLEGSSLTIQGANVSGGGGVSKSARLIE